MGETTHLVLACYLYIEQDICIYSGLPVYGKAIDDQKWTFGMCSNTRCDLTKLKLSTCDRIPLAAC